MISWDIVRLPQLGPILLAELDGVSLIYLGLGQEGPQALSVFAARHYSTNELVSRPSPLLEEAAKQIWQYWRGERQVFELPVVLAGTDFQKRVWRVMANVPFGETTTYGQIAASIGAPKALRAVGQACGANPVPIIIPCHRVLARNGLGGFSCGTSFKRLLLAREGIFK